MFESYDTWIYFLKFTTRNSLGTWLLCKLSGGSMDLFFALIIWALFELYKNFTLFYRLLEVNWPSSSIFNSYYLASGLDSIWFGYGFLWEDCFIGILNWSFVSKASLGSVTKEFTYSSCCFWSDESENSENLALSHELSDSSSLSCSVIYLDSAESFCLTTLFLNHSFMTLLMEFICSAYSLDLARASFVELEVFFLSYRV